MLHNTSSRPIVSYYCTIEVTPKGTFPLGTMLTVSNMKDLLPTVSTPEFDAASTTTTTDHPQDAVLNMDVVVDFSGYIIGGDATDELMEVCALSMRSALQSQLDLSIINGHPLHSCHVVYKCIHFRDCGLFQYPMQRVVEGLLGVVPEVLFDVLVPAPSPAQTNADVSGEEGVAATESSNSVIPAPQHQRQRCILNVSCESLDFGVNLFHTEYLTAFADELAWVVGSTSRLHREGNTALLDLAHCTIGLNYCTEITPSNVCQIVGTCLRAQATPSEEQAAAARYPFSIDVSGGTMVPLMPTTTNPTNNIEDDDVDGSVGVLNASDTLLSSSPMTLRKSSTFRLVVLSPKDGCAAMDGVASHADMVEHPQTSPTTSQCWRLQLLETLEYELLYLVGDGLLPSDGSNLPSVALDGFLDFPEGYTLQHNRNNNNKDNADNNDCGEEAGMRLLEFIADDGGASLRAILSSFAAEFPAACKCIRVPITAQRAAAASGAVVVGTVHDEVTNEDMQLSSSASPHRHDRKPLEETAMTTDAILLPCTNHQPSSYPSATTAPSDATLQWCSLEDVVHIVTTEVARTHEQQQQQQQHDDDEDVLGDTTLTKDNDASIVSVSSATDHHHTSPEQHHRLGQLDDDVDQQCGESVVSVEKADDQPVPDREEDTSLNDKSAILAASTSSASDRPLHHTPHTSTTPSKHLSPVDHSRLIPPSRRRLPHAAHSLADTENGLGACIDSCLHATTTSPSRSTVGPCRGGGGAASRSVSPTQHLVSSAVVAPTSPSSRSLSPSRTATDAVITTVAPVAVATLSEDQSSPSSPPSQSSGQVVDNVDDVHTNTEEDDTTTCSSDVEIDEDDEEICPAHRDNDLQRDEDVHSPIQGRTTTYSQDRAGSAVPMTPNHLNNTLPPGTNAAIASTPLGLVHHHHHHTSDPRSLSRVSSIAPTRTTSPINNDGGADGRSISPQHHMGGFSRTTSSAGEGGNAIVAGSTATARPNVMMMRGSKSWESGTVYMMSDVEHYGVQQQHRHQKPSSKTVISTVHIHNQNPHNAPRLESTSRSNSAASRVASLSPAPCQPYTTTSISRRGSTTSNGARMPTCSSGGGAISRTSSIALERQVDIPPNVQVHSLKSVSARVHPNTLLVASKPSPSAAAVVSAPTPATTPAKKPMKKMKKSTKKSSKSSATKKHAEAEAAVAPVPAPTTPSFFQGLLDRHERVKTDLALKGGVHKVRKSSMTTVSPTPCPSNAAAAPAPKPSSSAASRVASVSPVPVLPAGASSAHQVQQQVIPTHHADVVANPQDGSDSLADAVRRHLLLYAPRPIPVPVTEQCQAGLARCVSSRRSSSFVSDIHARCSSKGPKRSGTPQGSQPTSRSSSAAAASAAAPHVPTPSAFIDTMAPINVVKEVHTESPQSCWSEGGIDGGMHMSRSPSCQQPDGTTSTTTTPPAATSPPVEVAPAVVAVHRTSSVQVRVRRPSLRLPHTTPKFLNH